MMKFYSDSRLKNRGFCGITSYKNDFAEVCRGITTEAHMEKLHQLHINFFDMFEVICGPDDYDQFVSIWGVCKLSEANGIIDNEKLDIFLLDIFKRVLTKDVFISVIEEARKKGEIDGKRKTQNDLKKIMGIY